MINCIYHFSRTAYEPVYSCRDEHRHGPAVPVESRCPELMELKKKDPGLRAGMKIPATGSGSDGCMGNR
ncbi:MAG: hypothetical protein ABFC71_08705 [Methanoregula sp.]